MKVVIASDLHGSSYYAQRLKEIFLREKGDLLVLLGDIYYHGPRNPFPRDYAPMQVAEVLNSIKDKLLVIKGNCDSEVDTLISEFDFNEFSQIYVDGLKVTLTHGHRFNRDCMPANVGDLMCYGHFHVGFIDEADGAAIANPGSLSLPKDASVSSYLTLERGVVTLKDLSGNILDSKKIK